MRIETPYQILRRSDGKPATSQSRMWIVRPSTDTDKPIIYYHSSLTRTQFEAEKILTGFKGYLHTDGYQVYKHLASIDQVACWAHLRRKFHEVSFTPGLAGTGLCKCNEMFKLEAQLKGLSAEKRQRRQRLKPLFDEFFIWIDGIKENLSGKLKTAVEYAKNQKVSLLRVLEEGNLHLSNNICEQKMRPIAIGRKNYLFSTSEKGVTANAICYTLLESAKVNGINPFK